MRRSYKKRTGIGIIAFVVLIFCGIIFYGRIDLTKKISSKELDKKRLLAEITEQEERSREIDNLKNYVKSKKYIAEIAREQLGLVDKDDILFIAEEEEEE